MRMLMRNTVFKTAALAGLFLCVMAFAGAFSGITTSAHAIHADEVDTEEELKQFVEEAVDAYYIEFLLKQHCDLTNLRLPQTLEAAIPVFLPTLGLSVTITDLSPESINMLTIADVKKLIDLFSSSTVQDALKEQGVDLDIWGTCDNTKFSSFREVFGSGQGDWQSGPIYLFVNQYMEQDPQQTIIYHGLDMDLENQELKDLEDEGGRMVLDLINRAADGPVQDRTEKGFLDYCWDDPTVGSDDIEDMDSLTAPGDSWKTSYVVNPFDYLGVPAPSDSRRVIFGSGIYPKTGNPPPGCDGNGMADYDEEGMGDMEEPMEDMQEPVEESMDEPGEGEMEPAMPTSVSGGGCAITAGSDSTPRNDALNLLLIVSALFLAVLFRRRVTSKRNSVQF